MALRRGANSLPERADSRRNLAGRGSLFNLSKHVGGLPFVGRVPGNDLAVLPNQHRRERVGERLAVARRNANIEELSDCGKLLRKRRGEVPVGNLFVAVTARVGAAVATQHLWRVVARVEADTEQMRLVVERGIACESLVDVGEVVAHARAEVGQRTAR